MLVCCIPLADVIAQVAPSRLTIAVVDFTNGSLVSSADYAPLAKGMADLLGSGLRGNPALTVLERDALRALLDEQDAGRSGRIDEGTAARVGAMLGAQYLITGTFVIERKGRTRIAAQVMNTSSGAIVFSTSVDGSRDNLLEVIDALADQVNRGLKLGAIARRELRSPEKNGIAWTTVLTFSRALDADDRGDSTSAVTLYRRFLELSSDSQVAADRRRHAEARIRALAAPVKYFGTVFEGRIPRWTETKWAPLVEAPTSSSLRGVVPA